MTYSQIPAVDENFNFPLPVRTAFASSGELQAAIANKIASDPNVTSSAAGMAQSTAGLILAWKANTSYVKDQKVIAPNGEVVSSKAAHTSGVTYDANLWNWTLGLQDRGPLPQNTNADNLLAPGIYSIASTPDAATMVNFGVKVRSMIMVIAEASGARTQMQFPYTGGMLVRTRNLANGSWPIDWISLDPFGRALPDNTNVNEHRVPGYWYVQTTPNALTMTNLPVKKPGLLVNMTIAGATNNGLAQMQLYYLSGASPQIFYRTISGGTPGAYTWYDWITLTWTRDYGLGHEVNRQRERMSLGGSIGTDGKAVVAFAFDHNNTKFQEIVLPMLRSRGIPATMAQFVNVFTPDPGYTNDVSTGYGWTDVQNACLRDGVEVFSHGWTHQDQNTQAAYEKEILDSRTQLEANMPLVRVKGFIVPGVVGTSLWGNFNNNLNNFDVWRSTEAGRLVASNYGSANGGGAQIQPLNTGATLGWVRRFIDDDTSSATQINVIKTAQLLGQASVIALHPSQLDRGAGYITSQVFSEILDYVMAEWDAGRLEVLTVTGMLHADTERKTRNNLVRDTNFTIPGTYWSGYTQYSFSNGVATSSASGGMLSHFVNLDSSQSWAKGSARMLSAEFASSAGATVRIRAYNYENPSQLDVSRDVVLPSGSTNFKKLRQPIHLPTSGISNLRVEFGRVSGGSIQLKNPRLEAV
ncbi:tail protein [Arthrobacter phage Correa]|uniref:NodB homology domain-containing protein n=1 Tax=Arthrobacter phage Correa TaxID=2024275 RepID=A0A222Z7Q3_9CAUD|nr:tail protein [Arthrobacter phage Correa]ASR80080.1 hypothetical protein SEA_CORREA_19 [Arthrobacter phage Correa]